MILSTRAPIGYVGIAGVPLCTNQGCRALVFRNDEYRRFFYFEVLAAKPILESMGRGSTFKELAKDDLEGFELGVPSPTEQASIAAFLDRETTKIDALVVKKERLIELLQEKRAALIMQAVTKGLDPNAPMKDSGVEWLGEIPAHWDTRPLSQLLSRITYGFTNPMPVVEEGPYMLTALDIGDGEILYETARRTTEEAFERNLTDKSRPRAADILVTKDGTLGRVAVADGRRVCINQSVALLRFDPNSVSIDFVQNALRSAVFQERMAFEAGGTTIKHIYISRLAKMHVPIPPRDAQDEISAFIARRRTQIDSLAHRVRDGIECLKQFRTALISAAVTGKIDVREATV
jgi:type I restriction enzyme S subunit